MSGDCCRAKKTIACKAPLPCAGAQQLGRRSHCVTDDDLKRVGSLSTWKTAAVLHLPVSVPKTLVRSQERQPVRSRFQDREQFIERVDSAVYVSSRAESSVGADERSTGRIAGGIRQTSNAERSHSLMSPLPPIDSTSNELPRQVRCAHHCAHHLRHIGRFTETFSDFWRQLRGAPGKKCSIKRDMNADFPESPRTS
jgi:hypothetical protein